MPATAANPKAAPTKAAPAAPAKSADAASAGEVKVKKPRLPKHSVKLRDGQKNTLRFTAKQREKDVISFATYSTRTEEGKKSTQRGVSLTHSSFDEAKSVVEANAQKAIAIGWVAARRSGGAKKDTFTLESLPAPKQ